MGAHARPAPTVGRDATVGEARRAIGDAGVLVVTLGALVVDGVVHRTDLAEAADDAPVAGLMSPARTVRPGTPIDELHAREPLVVTTADGRLVGIVTRPGGPRPG